MTFYERYAKIAEAQGLDPCSQKAADLFDITKATISAWGIKSTTPKGETVAVMADKLGVSADYLLGRTDDPTDHTRMGTAKKVIASAIPPSHSYVPPVIMQLYDKLDDSDKLKAEGVIQGMLMQDKYIGSRGQLLNAAHVRTDIPVNQEMIDHDTEIMNSSDF